MFRDCRPRIVHWEVYKNPLIRRILRISESSRIRYEKAKRALYYDKSLTDNQRSKGVGKALDRYLETFKKTGALERKIHIAWERQEARRLKTQRA
jgi:hypothetical protein